MRKGRERGVGREEGKGERGGEGGEGRGEGACDWSLSLAAAALMTHAWGGALSPLQVSVYIPR